MREPMRSVFRHRPPAATVALSAVVLMLGASCQGGGGGQSGPAEQGGRVGSGLAGRDGAGGASTPGGGGAGGGPAGSGAGGDITPGDGGGGAPASDAGIAMDAAPGDAASSDLPRPPTCPHSAVRAAASLPPDVLILFDRSGSMNEDLSGTQCSSGCGATSKWSVATAAVESFLPTTESTTNWGLKFFATGSNNCSVSTTAEVAPAPMNAATIAGRIDATLPGSNTPTTAALLNAATYLMSLTDPNPKFILLVTDGLPGCGTAACDPANTGVTMNTCDDANAIAMVKTVHDMGIPVFVLGIGTAGSPGDWTLSQMAINGGYPQNTTTAYFSVDSGASLMDALGMVAALAGGC